MTEIGVYGGFGSSKQRIDYVAQSLGKQAGVPAQGMNFRQASQNLEAMAKSMEGRTAYFHSAGIMLGVQAIKQFGVRPERIIAIAPPIREQIGNLCLRGAYLQLGVKSQPADQLEEKLSDGHELLLHPLANYRKLGKIASFNVFKEAANLRVDDHDISLIIMQDDRMFDYSTDEARLSIKNAESAGVSIHRALGGHNTFTHNPAGLLDGIDYQSAYPPYDQDSANLLTIQSLLAAARRLPQRLPLPDLHRRQTV